MAFPSKFFSFGVSTFIATNHNRFFNLWNRSDYETNTSHDCNWFISCNLFVNVNSQQSITIDTVCWTMLDSTTMYNMFNHFYCYQLVSIIRYFNSLLIKEGHFSLIFSLANTYWQCKARYVALRTSKLV